MVEYTAHIEADDTMTGNTIDIGQRMADRLTNCGNAMAGIATEIRNHGCAVVGIGAEETDCRMAVSTFRGGIRVRRCGCLADRHGAVVTIGAQPGNSRMIETAVRVQCQETGSIVAVVALGVGRQMRRGFTDRQNPVMALAAIAKHFLVIDIRNYVKTQRGMAGFAHAAGGEVIRRFPRDFARSR